MEPDNLTDNSGSSKIPPDQPPPLSETSMLEPGEHIVRVVRRHYIGMLAFYIETFAGVAAILSLVIILFPTFFSSLSNQSYPLLVTAVVLALALLFFILFLATYIYRQSELVITDKNVVQVLQRGLFIRKVSRLSMSNVEDVNAEHRGILGSMLDYGTLNIQTAGEVDNFVFPYCPNPDEYAQKILEAREQYAHVLRKDD